MVVLFQVVRRNRRRRAAFALSVGCLALTIPGLASADSGVLDAAQVSVPDAVDETLNKGGTPSPPPLDTVEDTIESVLDPVDDATQPVKDAVKPVTDPVDDTVDTVTDTVDEGTTPVTDIIDDPTKPVTDGTGGTTTRPPPVFTPDDRQGRSGRAPGDDITERRRERAIAPGAPSRRIAPAPVAVDRGARPALSPARADATTRSAPTSGGSAAQQIGQAIVDASRAFRFPLLVAAAVLLFLAIQGRIDGRDPKLAHGGNDEELMFA